MLEIVVARMACGAWPASQIEQPLRMIGVWTSVAIDRARHGQWIGAPPPPIFNCNPNKRPVPLHICVQGLDINNCSAMQLAMWKPCQATRQPSRAGDGVGVVVQTRTPRGHRPRDDRRLL
jgi:hypothetical protein